MDRLGVRCRRMSRSRRGPKTMIGLLVAVVLIFTAAVAGCGGSSTSATGAPSKDSATPSKPMSASTLPTEAQLQSALLQATDLGSSFSLSTAAGGTGTSSAVGCEPLASMLNASAGAQERTAEVEFSGGSTGPFVGETLTAEGQAALSKDYEATQVALSQCRTLSFVSGGTTLTFSLTPIHFGGSDSTAVRMDGTYQGVEVNGYLAIEKINSTALSFYFFQVGSGSSQSASLFDARAVAKAQRVLGGDSAASPVSEGGKS